MGLMKYALALISALSVVVLLLWASVWLPTFSMRFYTYEFEKNGTYAQIGIEPAELARVTEHLLGYMKGGETGLNVEAVVRGEKRLYFNEREIAHMVDVRALFDLGGSVARRAVFLFCGSLVLMGALYKRKEMLRAQLRMIRVVSGGILALSAVLAVIISLDFSKAFTIFHQIFFTNDLWILDEKTDLLLNMVPQPFFVDIAILVAALFFGFLLLLFIFSAFAEKRMKRAL